MADAITVPRRRSKAAARMIPAAHLGGWRSTLRAKSLTNLTGAGYRF